MSDPIRGSGQTSSYVGGLPDAGPVDGTAPPPPSGTLGVQDGGMPDAQRDQVSGNDPTLPPSGPVGSGDYGDASVRLSSFVLSPVNIQDIAKMIMENDLEGRKAARTERHAEMDMNVALQHQAADKMRDQAAFAFAAAVTMSAVSMGGAVVSGVGAAKAGKIGMEEGPSQTGTATKLGKDPVGLPGEEAPTTGRQSLRRGEEVDLPEESAPKKNAANDPDSPTSAEGQAKAALTKEVDENTRVMRQNTQAQVTQARYGAIGTMITESGKIGGAALNYEAAQMDADKADLTAEASKAQTRSEDASDFVKSYSENIQTVLEKLAAMQESQADSMRQIVRA